MTLDVQITVYAHMMASMDLQNDYVLVLGNGLEQPIQLKDELVLSTMAWPTGCNGALEAEWSAANCECLHLTWTGSFSSPGVGTDHLKLRASGSGLLPTHLVVETH